MQAVIQQMRPSSISKVWGIDLANKKMTIPKPLERTVAAIVKHILNRTIKPILWEDLADLEGTYLKKIPPFQTYCNELIQVINETYSQKQRMSMDLTLYEHTISLINSNPIFAKDRAAMIETVEILKDYEMNIYHIITKRLPELEKALNEIDVNDFLNSLYGSYIAVICFWFVAYDAKQNRKTMPAIASIAHKLAKKLEGYTDTLDILSNPEEMALLKKSEEVEKLS